MDKIKESNGVEEDFIKRVFEMFLEFCQQDPNDMSQALVALRDKIICHHEKVIEENEDSKNRIEYHVDAVKKAIKIIS